MKGVLFILSVLFCMPCLANTCIEYKTTPRIIINAPNWTKQVVQPNTPMDLWHGNVVATLSDNYDIITDIKPTDGGYCIVLREVNAVIGYSDFLVNIDIRHTPDTCAYNAILSHEQQHIDAYLSVINDFNKDLHNSLYSASDSIMPVFVKSKSEIDSVVEQINNQLQSHPELVLIKQKLNAAQEIKNKRIDIENTGNALQKCFD